MKNYIFTVPKERIFLMADAAALSPEKFLSFHPEYQNGQGKDVLVLGTIKHYEIRLATYFPEHYTRNSLSGGYSQINIYDIASGKYIETFYTDPASFPNNYDFTSKPGKTVRFVIRESEGATPPLYRAWNALLDIFS